MLRKIVFTVAFVFLACIGSAVLGGATDLVVDSQFVSDKLGKTGWIILDVRTAEEYRDGHIPTAVNLGDVAAKVLRDPTHRAYTVVPAIEKKLGDAGIGNDQHIIVYGKAADAYYNTVNLWILEFLGCNSPQLSCTAHYYDGGIEQWESYGGKLEGRDSFLPKTQFKAKVVSSRLATSEEVLRVVKGQAKAVLIDVRTDAEYNGSDIRALRGDAFLVR